MQIYYKILNDYKIMESIKLSAVLISVLLVLSCSNNKQKENVDFEDDLTIEDSMTIIPGAIEQMDFPEFDYSMIIEEFKKGERLNAAELMDDYANNMELIKQDLNRDQQSELHMLINDMKSIARQIRSKKISDSDDLLAECMLLDKNIGDIFIVNEE